MNDRRLLRPESEEKEEAEAGEEEEEGFSKFAQNLEVMNWVERAFDHARCVVEGRCAVCANVGVVLALDHLRTRLTGSGLKIPVCPYLPKTKTWQEARR